MTISEILRPTEPAFDSKIDPIIVANPTAIATTEGSNLTTKLFESLALPPIPTEATKKHVFLLLHGILSAERNQITSLDLNDRLGGAKQWGDFIDALKQLDFTEEQIGRALLIGFGHVDRMLNEIQSTKVNITPKSFATILHDSLARYFDSTVNSGSIEKSFERIYISDYAIALDMYEYKINQVHTKEKLVGLFRKRTVLVEEGTNLATITLGHLGNLKDSRLYLSCAPETFLQIAPIIKKFNDLGIQKITYQQLD